MRHLILAGLAFAGLVSQAEPNCFIDGAMVPRCYDFNNFKANDWNSIDYGVSWPVFTHEDPVVVWNESIKRGGPGSIVPYLPASQQKLDVRHIRIDTPEHYPDVICIDFYLHGGKKTGQTCFDTMEITER